MAWGRDRPRDSHCHRHRSCCKSKNKGKDTGKRGVGDREEEARRGEGHREVVHMG